MPLGHSSGTKRRATDETDHRSARRCGDGGNCDICSRPTDCGIRDVFSDAARGHALRDAVGRIRAGACGTGAAYAARASRTRQADGWSACRRNVSRRCGRGDRAAAWRRTECDRNGSPTVSSSSSARSSSSESPRTSLRMYASMPSGMNPRLKADALIRSASFAMSRALMPSMMIHRGYPSRPWSIASINGVRFESASSRTMPRRNASATTPPTRGKTARPRRECAISSYTMPFECCGF